MKDERKREESDGGGGKGHMGRAVMGHESGPNDRSQGVVARGSPPALDATDCFARGRRGDRAEPDGIRDE